MKRLTARPTQGNPVVLSQQGTDDTAVAEGSAMMRWLSSAALVLPRRTPWAELTRRQRSAVITRGAVQFGLLAAALRDLRKRPADGIRGPKAVWVAVSAVNYLGLGPLVYFVFGRRRSAQASHGT
jgi:hypothetical protein